MSCCKTKTCKKYFNPFSIFSFLRTTARKHKSGNGKNRKLKKLRKTLKLTGGWKRKPKK